MDVSDFLYKKQQGRRLAMLTAYDYPTAKLVDEAGIEVILVGDSLANVVLGLESTTQVGMAEMLHHTRAVARGAARAFVVADMPFDAYQHKGMPLEDIVSNARQLMEAGARAVKVEWFTRCPGVVRALMAAGIPVMGHVGLTPQTALELGGFKVQGRSADAAARILEQARTLEKEGCFAVVLECVPEGLAREMTAVLKIPVIGIGAGKYCDGQVLVVHDLLGLYGRAPSFAKCYVDLGFQIRQAVGLYKEEVEKNLFPGSAQTFL